MSATGRNTVRLKDDFYQTPPWAFHWFEEELRRLMPPESAPRILEPGAGAGNLVAELRRVYPTTSIVAVEKREECSGFLREAGSTGVLIDDFLSETANIEMLTGHPFDLVFGNPPYGGKKTRINPHYGIWQRFVERGMDLLAPNGMLVFLLRLAVLEGKDRNRWIRQNMPDVYVLPRRPAFRGGSSTDATAYAWMVWNKRWWGSGKHGKIMVLEDWRLR